MKLIIKNTEIEIKSKMRAYLIYEQLTDKAFNPKTMTEIILYFYSLVMANAPTLQLTFDEFMDYMDENPNALNEFNQWLLDETKVNGQFQDLKKNKMEKE